jgi:hypothetical protein
MKKPLLISLSLLSVWLISGIYAQTTGATWSLVDKMKAAARNSFTLSADLNAGETGLQSAPVKGKKTGDILTAGEWNRVLEIVSQGSAGGGSPMGKANLDTGWLNYYPTADPKFTDSAFVYGSKKLNFSDFTHNLWGNKDNYLVDVQYDQSEAGWGISEIPLHANNEDIVWHNLTNNSINLNNVHSPAVNIKVRIRIWDTSLASVSTNGGLALYKCTNAQSLDTTNTPCYGASRNGGAGTNQYRVVSCSNTDASGTYTAGGLLNFGDFIANKWSFHINNSNIACTDGTILVMDILGGGGNWVSATCPSGFVAVGSYCIEPTMWPTNKTWYEAAVACADKGAQLCSWSEWSVACKKNKLTDVQFGTTNGKYEWIDDYGGSAYQGIADPRVYSDCEYLSLAAPKTPNATTAYRCCSAQK